jgi:hypothetical protein
LLGLPTELGSNLDRSVAILYIKGLQVKRNTLSTILDFA